MNDLFDSSITFADLGLHPDVLKGVDAAGFKHPTLIQAQLIPVIMQGKDVIGQAKTGTGKTAAFGLPVLHSGDPNVPMQALILVPTRELAVQVADEIEHLGKFTGIRTSCIIGGESMRHQIKSVKSGGHIIVGTPGRVMDLQSRGDIHFHNVRFVGLDEVDRMLDIGFREDIRKILKIISQPHQTVFVSATIGEEIERLARSFMKPDAQKVVTVSGSLTVSLVDQKYLPVEPWDKNPLLLHLLRHKDPDTTLIFCRTKATVHRVCEYLKRHGIEAREIHGDLAQQKRTSVLNSLRQGNLDVLVASDLAARGLDVEHISHVVNFDLPEDPEIYIHRIGRTARAGRRGIAWSFVTPEQGQLLTEIEMLAGAEIHKMEYPDFTPGPLPADVAEERARSQRPKITAIESLAARVKQSKPEDTNQMSDAEIRRMFPDGNIPTQKPRQTLGSRFRTRRG